MKVSDWAEPVLQTGSQQNHFISAKSGYPETSYRFRRWLSKAKKKPFQEKTAMTASTSKAAFDSKLSKVVEAGMSVNMVYDVQDD